MRDPRYRNPSWVTGRLIEGNGERVLWSARFEMPTAQALERVKAGFIDAGASRVFSDERSDCVAVVEFMPVLVRRVAAIAVALGGVPLE